MIRVVFAEDNYLVREGTAVLLATSDQIELVGIRNHPRRVDRRRRGTQPRCRPHRHPDASHGGTNEGIEAAKEIRAPHPREFGVVVLSQFVEEDYAYDLLKDGAGGLGYLLKERVADVDELVRALGEVARGGSVLDPKVVEALVTAKDRMAHSPLAQLTDREREVLSHMAQGENNAAIASSLFLTERAVEKHINSLFHKLGLTEEPDVHRRVMAVLAFLRETDHA